MKDIGFFIDNAQYLCRCLNTNWQQYDFQEIVKETKRRVPDIMFPGVRNVEVEEIPSNYVKSFGTERFIRNYIVTYKDGKYRFVITVTSHFDCVKLYELEVYIVFGNKESRIIYERL